jgi:hypothetical protein
MCNRSFITGSNTEKEPKELRMYRKSTCLACKTLSSIYSRKGRRNPRGISTEKNKRPLECGIEEFPYF